MSQNVRSIDVSALEQLGVFLTSRKYFSEMLEVLRKRS
jgi:hypothetical protein